MFIWIIVALCLVVLMIGLRGYFRMLAGEDLSRFDALTPATFDTDADAAGLQRVNAYLIENFVKPAQRAGAKTGWTSKRERFEKAGLARTDLDATYQVDVAVIDGQEVPGAWTIVKGADTTKRILYLHGGAFTVGSAISHRPITVNLAKRTGAVVFAPNYRLMPENPRLAPNEDSQLAYDWIIENGPNGPEALNAFAIAGDSAGGNLTLSLINWARDTDRRAVNAAYALSPNSDSTIGGVVFQTKP
ncbi:alpha/beta hydrolase [Litorimonas sp. RW-G-Af-16]|uniref:alpha/beta hydrolase n=1 Tax=Litorimonas sp. RW-G-Af-16 TaxID=3241168 RepID=UPI003AAB407C